MEKKNQALVKKENKLVSELIKNPSFRDYAEGTADKEEMYYWDKWIQQSADNRSAALVAQQKILGFSVDRRFKSRVSAGWKGVESAITKKNAPARAKPEYYRASRLLRKKKASGQALRIAAIIAIMAAGGVFWATYFNIGIEERPEAATHIIEHYVETEFGETRNLRLSDGSQIVLNANSSLRYINNVKENNNISIELEGEAFFSVPSRGHSEFGREEDVFRVATKDGVVRVLGTEFSMSSYNNKTTVVLENGLVSVRPYPVDDNVAEKIEEVILQPNELIEFSRESNMIAKRKIADTRTYTSWKESRLFFENASVREVIQRFEQTFGVPFEVTNPDLLNRTISGSVENTDLETMVKIFSETLNIRVQIFEDRIVLN